MKKILIIDDDPDALLLLQRILNKHGFAVDTAMHENEVYTQVAAQLPDLILLDVLLSGADGRAICRKLKASAHRHIPIIIFSGHPGAQKNYAACGADDFVYKPFQEGALLEKIRQHLLAPKEVSSNIE
jgi:DNA-binding response OmpR family regulator